MTLLALVSALLMPFAGAHAPPQGGAELEPFMTVQTFRFNCAQAQRGILRLQADSAIPTGDLRSDRGYASRLTVHYGDGTVEDRHLRSFVGALLEIPPWGVDFPVRTDACIERVQVTARERLSRPEYRAADVRIRASLL